MAAFDHAIIGVGDLEAARRVWQRLGFTTCPRGKHIGWGTANYCIMFADDYLELLGIVDASQFTNHLDRFLADHGEGWLGMAFASDDVAALAEQTGGQPQDLKRLLEMPDGVVEPRFRLLHPPKGTLPGLSGFFCQHLSPELMRRPEWLIHANGAQGISAITLGVEDVTAAKSTYQRLFGAAFVAEKLRFVEGRGGLSELSITVADLARTGSFFEDAGIVFRQMKNELVLQVSGATLIFS